MNAPRNPVKIIRIAPSIAIRTARSIAMRPARRAVAPASTQTHSNSLVSRASVIGQSIRRRARTSIHPAPASHPVSVA